MFWNGPVPQHSLPFTHMNSGGHSFPDGPQPLGGGTQKPPCGMQH